MVPIRSVPVAAIRPAEAANASSPAVIAPAASMMSDPSCQDRTATCRPGVT